MADDQEQPSVEEQPTAEESEATEELEAEQPEEEGVTEQEEAKEEVDWEERYKGLQRTLNERDEQYKRQFQELQSKQAEAERKAQMAEAKGQHDSEYGRVLSQLRMQAQTEIQQYKDSGEETAARLAERYYQDRERELNEKYQLFLLDQTNKQSQYASKVQQAAQKHGLSPEDISEIYKAADPELAAENIALKRKIESEKVEKAQAQRQPQDFTSPTPTGAGSREAFEKRMADPNYEPTAADYERAMKELDYDNL